MATSFNLLFTMPLRKLMKLPQTLKIASKLLALHRKKGKENPLIH